MAGAEGQKGRRAETGAMAPSVAVDFQRASRQARTAGLCCICATATALALRRGSIGKAAIRAPALAHPASLTTRTGTGDDVIGPAASSGRSCLGCE